MAIPFTAYPVIPQDDRPHPVRQAADSVLAAIQQYAAMQQQQAAVETARQQKLLEFAKFEDDNGPDAVARFQQLGGRIPGQPAEQTPGFWGNLFHGQPSPAAANPAPATLTSAALAPNQAIPRTPTSAPTFTPTEREDVALQNTPGVPAGVAMPATPGTVTPAAAPAFDIKTFKPKSWQDYTPEVMAGIKAHHGRLGVERAQKAKKDMMDEAVTRSSLAKDENTLAQGAPYNADQVLAALSPFGDKGKEAAQNLINAHQGRPIPKDLVHAEISGLSAGMRGEAMGGLVDVRKQGLHLKMAEDYEKSVNPATAPAGTLVGIAGRANSRADRALQVLRNPNMTYADVSTVVADISGIFQGGVPHEQSLRDQNYGTALQKLSEIKTYFSGKPAEGLVTPELREKLKQVITDVKRVDNKVLEDNLKSKRRVYGSTAWAKENPGAMDEIERGVRNQYIAAGEDEGGGTPVVGPYNDAAKEARYQAWKASQAKL